MFEEFAIDPASFAQWEFFKELRDKFGLDKGRLIADFPHKGWKKTVASLIAANHAKANPVRNASTLEAWLRSPDGMADSRFVRRKRPYEPEKKWVVNAVGQAETFHAVLSDEKLDLDNAIHLTETLCLSEHPNFQVETQPRIPRTNEDLIEVAMPLLRHARMVKWVDRFFDPSDPRKSGPFKHMLHWLRDEVSHLRNIELHTERSDSFSEHTKTYYRRELEKMLPPGFQTKVFFWKSATENLHPRFLLTDVGGLQYDYGLDRGSVPTETTIVVLADRKRWEDEWRRYSTDSEDLDIDLSKHVLEVTG